MATEYKIEISFIDKTGGKVEKETNGKINFNIQ